VTARGLDVLQLLPSDQLTQHGLGAARDDFHSPIQPSFTGPVPYVVSWAFVDQLMRDTECVADRPAEVLQALAEADRTRPAARPPALNKLAAVVPHDAAIAPHGLQVQVLVASVRQLVALRSAPAASAVGQRPAGRVLLWSELHVGPQDRWPDSGHRAKLQHLPRASWCRPARGAAQLLSRRARMRDPDATPILRRLLTLSVACRDAFLQAAYLVRSPRLTTLFMRHAEHHERIGTSLTQRLHPGSAPAVSCDVPPRGQRGAYALLGASIRTLDASIHEFARAYSPAMPLVQRISLDRHYDQMRWSREELIALRQSYKPVLRFLRSPTPVSRGERDAPSAAKSDMWFGVPLDRTGPDVGSCALAAFGGTFVHEHESGGTS